MSGFIDKCVSASYNKSRNKGLELMKIIWGNGGTALYAQIMEALSNCFNSS